MAHSVDTEEEPKTAAKRMILRGYGDARIMEETGLPEKTVKGIRAWLASPRGKESVVSDLEEAAKNLREEIRGLEEEKEELRSQMEMLGGFSRKDLRKLRVTPMHEVIRRSLDYAGEPRSLLLVEAKGEEIAELHDVTEGVIGYLGGPSGYALGEPNEDRTAYGLFLHSDKLAEILQRRVPRAKKILLDIITTRL